MDLAIPSCCLLGCAGLLEPGIAGLLVDWALRLIARAAGISHLGVFGRDGSSVVGGMSVAEGGRRVVNVADENGIK